MGKTKSLAEAEALLRQVCPPPKGLIVKVKLVDPKDVGGSDALVSKSGRVFTIRVNRELDPKFAESCLVHEWSHVLCWRPYHPLTGDHDAMWGVAYAMVYQAFYQER